MDFNMVKIEAEFFGRWIPCRLESAGLACIAGPVSKNVLIRVSECFDGDWVHQAVKRLRALGYTEVVVGR